MARFGIASGLAAALVVLAAGATAATRTETTPVPATTQVFHRVGCPTGRHVKAFGVTGQFAQYGEGPSDLPVELAMLNASHVIAGARSTDQVNGSFQTLARCGHAPALSEVAEGEDVGVGIQKSVKATCPRGSTLRLGGFRQELGTQDPGEPFVMINGLERVSSRSWKVSAINLGEGAGRLTSFAYCGARVHHVHAVEKTVNVQDGHYGKATANCPRGSRFLMGGLRIQHYDTFQGDIYPTSMGPKGRRGWFVKGFKYQPVAGHLTAIAYCSG